MSINNRFPITKVAAIQASPVIHNAPDWFDLPATLDKATSLIAEAGKNGARLIVFPECWIPTFPYWGFDFSDLHTFRDLWAAYLWSSIKIPSKEVEILGKAAKKANAFVVIGINEQDARFHGRMYNSILYLNPKGEILGTHRKICNTFGERLFHTPGDGGENLKAVFQTEIGNIGGSICGEHSQLTLIYNWIMQGINIHCSLWPGLMTTKVESDICTRAVCRVSHSFGIMSASYFNESDLPAKFYKNSAFTIPGMICGGSAIINPSGEYIAGPVYNEEAIIYADIDMSDIDKTRFAVNLTGAYSRWDLLSLNICQESYEPVIQVNKISENSYAQKNNREAELELRVQQLEQKIEFLLSKKADNSSESV